ncbi:MAG: L-asparaginase 1, partial [Clostridia bacterium]|nr:L-asparaginase 1 [Clostridia bacterium]
FDAVIIEGFGVGGLPEGTDGCFKHAIEQGIANGKLIVMTTQVQNEGSNLTVYQVGHALKQQGIVEAFDMTTEAAVAKLMWIMGETRDPLRVRERFYSPVSHDILYTEAE